MSNIERLKAVIEVLFDDPIDLKEALPRCRGSEEDRAGRLLTGLRRKMQGPQLQEQFLARMIERRRARAAEKE